jgi:hypothetical protein
MASHWRMTVDATKFNNAVPGSYKPGHTGPNFVASYNQQLGVFSAVECELICWKFVGVFQFYHVSVNIFLIAQ